MALTPFDGELDAPPVAGLTPFNGKLDGEKEQDNPLVRGWNKMVGSVGITKSLATSNYDETAQKIDEAARYQAANPGSKEGNELMAAWQRGNEKPVDGESVTDQISRTARNTKTGAANVAGEFAKDWNEAPGVVSGIRETAKNVGAMGAGVVEQVPNMLLPMAGMLAGGTAGSQAGPIGTIGGAWLGASAGNTLVEGGGMAQEALQKAGINPSDKAAVKAYFEKNGYALLAQAGIKGGIIGAVDTATMGIASKLLTAPVKAAAGRAMADMGVDVTDKVAVKAAMQSPELAARVASDPAYRAATTGVQGAARNTAAAALEPAGEFTGELVGQGVATGEWDVQNAALEAASSIGQSGATFAGQKAYAGLKYPFKANADQAAQLPDTGPMSRSANTAIASGAAADAASVLGVPADAEQAGEQIAPKSMDAIGRVQQIDQQIQSAYPEQAATMKAERDQITASWPRSVSGAPTSFSTESGARIDGNYALMEAHELVTSHDEKLKPNPAYPREMQPRERDRAASEMQISAIAQRLDPARLGESGDAGTGAPIVGADGLVESGNARTIALKRAYQGNPEKAEAYRQYLADNAARFGVTPEAVASMNTPVLVRVRNTPVDRAEFARQANASTVAQMSSSEQARADAARIDDMGDMRPDDNGDFATSRDFIRRFVSRLPATEQGGMVDSTGQLSQSGYARIRNAVLAKAYGESPVLARMVESMDDNMRNVGKALMQAAPEIAKLRQDVSEGALFDADITPDLLAAVEELSRIKDSGRSISDYLAQAGMFGDTISAEARDLLQFLAANLRRPAKIAGFIKAYADALRAAGNPNQGSLLGEKTAPTKREIINTAKGVENGQTETDSAATGQTANKPAGPDGNQEAGRSADEKPAVTPGDGSGTQGDETRLSRGPDGEAPAAATIDGRPYKYREGDDHGDNFNPGGVQDYIAADVLERADDYVRKYYSEKADPFITKEERERALALLEPVIKRAEAAKASYDQKVIDIAKRSGAIGQQLAPVKGLKRAIPKLVKEEKFDIDGMKDMLRSTIVVSSYADAQRVVDEIEKEFDLLRDPKNRTSDTPLRSRGKDIAPEDRRKYGGYSDVLVNVILPGNVIAEIQINIPSMLAAKDAQGHKLYEAFRDAPKDSPLGIEINEAMQEFYEAAFAARRSADSFQAAAELRNAASSDGKSDSGRGNPLGTKSPESDIPNTPPSGKTTLSSPPNESKNSQPGGNLSGNFISTTSKEIVAQGKNQAYTETDENASEAKNEYGNNGTPGAQGQEPGAVQGTGGKRGTDSVRDGTDRADQVGNHNADDGIVGQGAEGRGGPDGTRADAQGVRLDGEGNRAGRNAGIPAGRSAGEWVAFPPETGTLGIPRADMPQIKGDARPALIAFLKARGIEYATEDVQADSLRPTQAEFSIKKAVNWGEVREGVDRSVLASSDGFVLDGHHQWIAALAVGENVKAIHFDAPIDKLLAAVYDFPGAKRSNGAMGGRQLAQQNFNAALADLGVILRQINPGVRMLTPEEKVKLMPTLVKLFESGIQQVGYSMKDLIAHVKAAMRASADEFVKKHWNKVDEKTYREAAAQAIDNVQNGTAEPEAGQTPDMFAIPKPGPAPVQADMFAALEKVAPEVFKKPAELAANGRGYVGASLTKDQRKSVLKTLVDVYRQKNAPRESKGVDSNGNERSGYAYSPDLFEKSDITGAMVRYYVTLPDGRIAHPTELFADYTQSDIDAAMQKEIDAARTQERNDQSERERLLSLAAPTINEANGKFNHAQRFAEDRDSIIPTLLTNGELYLRSRPENSDKAAKLLGDGWRVETVAPAAVDAKKDAETQKPKKSDKSEPAGRDIPPKTGRNYAFGDDDLTYAGSWIQKATQNVEAVELLVKLDQEKRQATREEQAVLAKFIGWGASDLANSLFGDKLNKPLDEIRTYEQALEAFDKVGRDYLRKGGNYRGDYGDNGYYSAVAVLRNAGKVIGYGPTPERITKADVLALKPDMGAKKWDELRTRLKAVMSEEEWADAARSTQYAHYTSKPIVKSMMSALQRMGFKGGTILEPGAGIGVFPGLMPVDMANNSAYTGIEFDAITGRILKQLFPDERILVESFMDTALPQNYYDVAFGNPPFGDIPILSDPKYRKYAFSIHNYFFAKTLDSVKPGGLVQFVTSRYTMDNLNDKARAFMAERADLVGAIRLPQTAFKKNAGTDVVTDVLFLRKKVPGETFEHGQPWAKSVPITINGRQFNINEYFHAHPEMVLGKNSDAGKMANSPDPQYTVEAIEGDIDALFDKAAGTLPDNIYHAIHDTAAEDAVVRDLDFNPKAKKEGNYYVTDAGVLMVREGGIGKRAEIKSAKAMEIIKDFVPLRDALKQAHFDQLNNGEWEKSLAELQKAYRAFVKKNGQIHKHTTYMQNVKVDELDDEGNPTGKKVADKEQRYRFPTLDAINDDPDYTLVAALESFNEETGEVKETAFLTDRVLQRRAPAKVETPTDAMLQVLNDIGKVSIAETAKRIGLDEQETIAALGSLVYDDPSSGWVTADDYLSGDIRKKLKAARAAAETDKRYQRNVEALISVLPNSKTAAEITPQIGMSWIPTSIYEEFLLEKARVRASVSFNERTGQWDVQAVSGHKGLEATQDWGTDRRNAADILGYALSGAPVRIMSSVGFGKDKKDVFDSVATQAVTEKLNNMREAFKTWLWEDPGRVETLVPIYNEKFNSIVPRSFNGDHLTLPGVSERWMKLGVFPHVKRGAWRIIQQGNTYLAHAVGSGKTNQMIISAMEQKRLGLIQKPMMVVPNHMLKQFSSEWMDLYPAARLMVADEASFTGDNRRRFVARAALSDLDGVIITHSAFKLLDLDPVFKQKKIEEQLEYLRAALKEVSDTDKKDKNGKTKSRDPKVKQIERKIERWEQKLAATMSSEGKDKNVRFDEMGVDMLYVDEAHEFRKLEFATQRQVKGIDSGGSDRAADLHMKVQWLRENKNPNRNLVMASGTPVTNTLAEIYSVQRFMAPDVLAERGLEEFDQWASMFGAESTNIEPDASGKYGPVTRFNKFVNVGELTQMFREFADVLTSDYLAAMLGDKRPKVKGGSRNMIITPKTPAYTDFQRDVLQPRMKTSREWKPSKDEPNNPDPIIAIIGDGRLAAIDLRFMDPKEQNDPDSKLNRMIDEVIRVYKETADREFTVDGKPGSKIEPAKGAVQMVFADLGFGAGVAANRGFNARAWFEKRLRDAGVKPEHVAFMSDNKKSSAKVKLFRDMNAGRVRIAVGSSKNMGTGVNAQQRLAALHHLDSPWYPADLEQREGRIVRQGNKHKEVELYAYAMKGSYDEQMWSTLARKQFFIDQALSGDANIREIEDLGESSQFEIAAAMVADDPRVLQLAGLRAEVEKLTRLRYAHEDQRGRMQRDYTAAGARLGWIERKLEESRADAAKVQDITGDNFTGKADGKTFKTRKEWGQALMARYKDLSDHLVEKETVIGSISGFNVVYAGKMSQYGVVKTEADGTAKMNHRFESAVALMASEPILIAQDVTSDPVGVSMRAQSALAGIARAPAALESEANDLKAKRNALEPRLTAQFPMIQMLLDKQNEAAALEDAIVASGNEKTGLEREQELEDAWQARTGAITPLFSRGPGAGMAVRDLQATADRVSRGFKNLPKVHVFASPADLSANDPAQKALADFIRKAGAWEDVEGAMHNGEIYLFASGIADKARAEHVLATHEVTHYGLRGAMGKSLDAALQHIWLNNAGLRKQAAALKKRNGLKSNVEAIEEVLADIPAADLVKLKGWRRVVMAVRDWLNKAGATNLAARLDGWMQAGLDDQQKADLFVADLVNAARNFARNGKPASVMDGTRLADGTLAEDVAKQEKWLTAEAKARGYASIDELAEKNYPAFEKLATKWREQNPVENALLSRGQQGQFELVDIKTGKVVGGPYSSMQRARAWRERRDQEYGAIRYQIREIETGRPRLSRAGNTPTAAERADAILAKPAGSWRPVDTVMRGLTQAVRIDKATGFLYDKVGALIDRYTPEQIKAGVVSDYGIPEAVIDRRVEMQGRQRAQIRKTGALLEKLSTLTRAESRLAYEWMNNNDPQAAAYFEKQLSPESIAVMEEIKTMIDNLSQEAITLGQLSPEAYKRNRFEYLHRSYAKHTAEQTKGETKGRQRAIAVLGDQYKGRGMSDAVDMAKVQNIAPEWWGRKLQAGQADKGLIGVKFVRYERRAPTGEGNGTLETAQGPGNTNPQKKGKLLEVAYWPADEKAPAKYSTWDQSGTWEVRDTKGGKLIVWRDFTKAERTAMGEIDEARYAIAKTLHGMVHDIETGRYLEWIGRTYGKIKGEQINGEIVEASDRMRDTFAPGTWVQVPETKIPGTPVSKYGALAGKFIPGPIWNDVRQSVGFHFGPELWRNILGAWKTAKTALSPAVHTNNVMANFVMADWHDVSAGHIAKALRIILGASKREGKGIIGRTGNLAARAGSADAEAAREIIARFHESGANMGSWVNAELQRDQIEPLLDALEAEIGLAGQHTADAQVGAFAALQRALQLRFPSAWAAFKPTVAGKALTTEAGNMLDLYEGEDQVFRLAAWLKAKEDGESDLVAGRRARKSFLDYHINAPWIQAMRNSAFPFISFTYRSVPMLLEIAARKPHKLLKLAMFAGVLNALGYLMSGGDEDDERKLLPEEKAGNIWGMVPRLIRMPWNDKFGSPVFLDVRRFVPVGDIFDTGQNHAAVPLLPFAVPGGPLAIISEFISNKSQFTGKAITLETDTPIEKAEKVADHLYKAFAPNIVILPGTHAFTGVVNAGTGRTDSFGREQSVAQAGLSAFGVKVGSYPADVLQLNAQRQAQGQMMEIDRQLTQLKRERSRNGVDDNEFEDERDVLIVKKRGIAEDLQRRLTGR